jgi:hypothetical protein
VKDAVYDTVPSLLEDTLGDVRVEQAFDLTDNVYTISAVVQALDVDESGISIHMKTQVTPDEATGWGVTSGPTGSPYFGFDAPSWDEATGTSLALSTDFINQALFAFWRGGLLDQEVTDEDLGLEMSTISLLMPGLTDLTILSLPRLPPVAVPREDMSEGFEYDLQLGDMLLRVHNGEVATDTLYMDIYVAVTAPMNLDAGSDGASISLALGEPEVLVDVTYAMSEMSMSPESTEALLADLIPYYLPEITGALGEISLPSIEGFTLSSISTTMDGGDTPPGYWTLSGALE